LIISNPARRPVTAILSLTSGSSAHNKQVKLTLGPLQTARIDIREALGSFAGSDMGGLTLSLPNHEGVSASQIVFDEVTGLAAIMKLFERDNDELIATHVLRAPMMALTQPDPALAYPKDTVLNPRLFLRNAGQNKLQVSAAIHWHSQTTEGTYNYPPLSLGSNEVTTLDLGLLQNSGAIPASANWSNIALSYSGKSADLVPVAVSYDSKQRYGLQSPFTEGTNRVFKGGMWHVDSTHNSLITTGNGGSETTKAQVTLFYNGGKSRYRIEKLLMPGQQLLLDVGQLIRNQVPDTDGTVIPPETMMGSYELRDLDHPAVGLLYEGKLTIDKTYGHASYGCGTCCGYVKATLQPNPFSSPPGFGYQDFYQAQEQCGGTWDDYTGTARSWQSSNTAVATLPNSTLHTLAVGNATGSALNTLQASKPAPRCPQADFQGSQPVTVVPNITGSNTVWWFNGQNPPGYNTSVTLTSSGGSSTSWSITAGSDKVRLSGATGTSITVTSTGTAWSSFSGDIGIVATANSVPSATFAMTSRRPYFLAFPQFVPNCDQYLGYVDSWSYQIQDQLLTAMPAQVDWNEKFTTGIVDDDPPFDNWSVYGLPQQTGAKGTILVDDISGPVINYNPPPSPVPSCNGPGTQIQHWGQEFRIGTQVVGGGQRVQTDNLTRFVNHAEHDAQVSPAP
jgi:hypothetical protein